ncbi:MAG: amino acid ABC transporter substrate-binding protein [Ruminococcus sp.]|nr:amino acid ABC transporter substrate-binding protein [Ruminococcus sp.]
MKSKILAALSAFSLTAALALSSCGSSGSSSATDTASSAAASSAAESSAAASSAAESTADASTAEESKAADASTADSTAEPAADDSWDKVLANGKLILGLDATFKPMGYTDENDQIVGFDIDCAKEVCTRLGIELEPYGVNWETKEIDLDAGTIDCIWNGLSVSDERKKVMLMSDPYMSNQMVFVVNSDSTINSLADLDGKTVAVQNGSTAQEILAASDVGKTVTATELATNVEALNQLELNLCDAVFLDSVVAEYEITTSGKAFRVLEEGLEPEEYAIGFRLGDQSLCDKVYGTLKEMKADGKLGEISTKWFGKDITTVQ